MAGPAAATCEACGEGMDALGDLAVHLIDRAGASDAAHVMWLNRNVTKRRVDAVELTSLLQARAEGRRVDTDRVER